jgi:hypothetical protein
MLTVPFLGKGVSWFPRNSNSFYRKSWDIVRSRQHPGKASQPSSRPRPALQESRAEGPGIRAGYAAHVTPTSCTLYGYMSPEGSLTSAAFALARTDLGPRLPTGPARTS